MHVVQARAAAVGRPALAALLVLAIAPGLFLASGAWAAEALRAAVPVPLAKGKLVPPREPRVKPAIVQPADIDTNGDKIDDEIKPVGLGKLAAEQNEQIRVELVFRQQITQEQINAFIGLGGTVEYIYQAVSYGFHGVIARNLVDQIPALYGDALVVVAHERPVRGYLLYATRNGRVRPVWVGGFAGSTSGFSGNANTTIAIMDTGVDGTHTDLSGRQEYWHDYTSQALASAKDYNGHGTHVSGMAFGTGAAIGANPTQLQFTTGFDYVLEGFKSGQYATFPLHLTAGTYTLASTAVWNSGTVSTTLSHMSSPDGAYSWSSFNSATSVPPATLTSVFTASESNDYTATITCKRKISQFAIVNTLSPFPGLGDGYNVLRGVAPGCRWAGARVLGTDGSGYTADIGNAMDDMVVQNRNHNIKVVNMSFGGGANSTLRGKTNTMVNNGIVAVVSAGNSGGGASMGDPATAALAITVEASSRTNQLTDYSNGGLSSPGSDQDVKPDLTAPGGSFYRGAMLSLDSNSSDGESEVMLDQQPNDYTTMQGTSMASPFVAGAAGLVIDALQQSGLTWSFSSATHPLLVKMLLCATATETNSAREDNAGYNPTLGRAAAPKDIYEGYGILNVDAAIECAMASYSGGTLSDSTAGGDFDRRAWGRKVSLVQNRRVVFNLATPSSADFDLYLYSATPDSKGNPVILGYSTGAGNGVAESIDYTPSSAQTAYLVIKRVSGSGAWTLSTAATQFAVAGTASQIAGSGNALTITAQDGFGATVTGYSGAHALTFSGANPSTGPVTYPTATSNTGTPVQFGSPTNLTFSNGVSSAGGVMTLYKVESASIAATEGSLTTPAPFAVTVTVAAASKLAFTTQPGNGTGGSNLTIQPAVTVQDAYGNTVTTDGSSVTLAIVTNPSGGTLSGTKTVAASSGVATFSGLSIDKAGSGYTLSATDGTLTSATSNGFNITVGPASKLAFTTQPSGGTGGTAFGTQPVVRVQDLGGNTVTTDGSNVTLAIGTNPSGGTLSGTKTVAASGGVATFGGLSIDKAGSGYTLSATDGTLTSATSNGFNITVGPAAKLAFTTQPSGGTGGTAFGTQPVVRVQDLGGNTVTSASDWITLAIGNNPSGGTLSATTNPLAASGGVATFAGVKIDRAGNGYTLTASATGLAAGTSNSFDVAPPPTQITARETQDTNGNGKIDAIRIVTSAPLNDNFGGVNITVAGYTVTGYDTGSTANDNEFFVRLAEGATQDTDARPGVQVVAGGSLGLPVDAAPVTPTDKAKPVLMTASWYDGSGAGVDANDPIYLTFSEPVASNTALASDFGLPVSGDAFGAGASVSIGQDQQNPKMITITLQGDPLLTPGGLYAAGSLTPGSPTGIFVADGTRVVDAAGNVALIQTIGTAVDLEPGTESISIAWDDLTVAPRDWAIGASTIGSTHQAYGAFQPNGLIVRNNGNVRERCTVSCSGASPNGQAPYVWALVSTAGQDQFEMKAANSGAPYTAYPLDLATGPKDIAAQLYSGHNQAFDLQFRLPTSVTAGAEVAETVLLTITATKD